MNALLVAADADLYQAIQLGRSGWQTTAFERYSKLVRSQMQRVLGSTGESEELVSEVFLRFFERATAIRSAEGLRSYLVSIAYNTARGEIRARVRHRRCFASAPASTTFENALGTDDPKASAALAQLRMILGRLPEQDRQVFILRELLGLELHEVARHLGISRATTQRRVLSTQQFVQKSAARSALLANYVNER